jgi:hypothetical protein
MQSRLASREVAEYSARWVELAVTPSQRRPLLSLAGLAFLPVHSGGGPPTMRSVLEPHHCPRKRQALDPELVG